MILQMSVGSVVMFPLSFVVVLIGALSYFTLDQSRQRFINFIALLKGLYLRDGASLKFFKRLEM